MPRKRKNPKNVVIRDGKWYAQVKLPGFKNRVWRRVRDETEQGVKDVIETVVQEFRLAQLERERPKTLADISTRFLKSKKNKVSPRTFEDLTESAEFITARFGEIPIEKITPAMIEEFYLSIEDSGKLWRVSRIHTALRALFNYALRFDEIKTNPVLKVVPSKKPKKEIVAMTAGEAKTFLRACASDPRGLVFELALVSAMRPGECLALRWSDIDFESGTIHIKQSLSRLRRSGGYYLKELKTQSSRRSIPIPERIVEKLKTLQLGQKKIKKFKNAHNLVFCTDRGKPLNGNNLSRRELKDILKAAGLDEKKFNFYSLRHSCATILFHENISLKTVQERLGHSTANQTINCYIHFIPGLQKEASDKLANIFY